MYLSWSAISLVHSTDGVIRMLDASRALLLLYGVTCGLGGKVIRLVNAQIN
jgi:hypothetical protein